MAAALVTGGVLFYPRVAHAESPVSFPRLQPLDSDRLLLTSVGSQSKKPIYDDQPTTASSGILSTIASKVSQAASSSDPSTPARPTPTDRLAVEVGRVRLALYKLTASTEDAVNAALDRAFAAERTVSSTVASLHPAPETGEKLMPGLIYVLVAGLAGSIVARNRGVVLRAAAPLALGVGAGWLVIPATMGNVADLLWKWEEKVPAVAQAHVAAREGVQMGWRFVEVHSRLAVNWVDDKVSGAREAVDDWVKKGK